MSLFEAVENDNDRAPKIFCVDGESWIVLINVDCGNVWVGAKKAVGVNDVDVGVIGGNVDDIGIDATVVDCIFMFVFDAVVDVDGGCVGVVWNDLKRTLPA